MLSVCAPSASGANRNERENCYITFFFYLSLGESRRRRRRRKKKKSPRLLLLSIRDFHFTRASAPSVYSSSGYNLKMCCCCCCCVEERRKFFFQWWGARDTLPSPYFDKTKNQEMNKEREKKRAWLLLRAQLDKYLFLTFIQPAIWLVLPIWSCLCVRRGSWNW
jgi:hypothetical protein